MDKRGSVGEIVDLAIRVEGGASKIFEHADGTRNVVCDGVGDRFAVVECLQHRIIEKAFPDALCDGTQHHLALHRRRASPNREGPSGCFDGTIDVNGVSGLNISEISAGGRVLQCDRLAAIARSEEHTSELQSLMRISYAVFCLKKKQT